MYPPCNHSLNNTPASLQTRHLAGGTWGLPNQPPQRGDARHDRRDLRDGRYADYGARGPQFHRGGYIPREYCNRQYVVGNWQAHRLYAPQRGYQWVQVGSDYAMIAISTGLIP